MWLAIELDWKGLILSINLSLEVAVSKLSFFPGDPFSDLVHIKFVPSYFVFVISCRLTLE
jgi:hypothetical protein